MKWSYSRVIEAAHLDDANSVANEALVGFLFSSMAYFFWYHGYWPVALFLATPAVFAFVRVLMYVAGLLMRRFPGNGKDL